jgi:hypothetical protein
MQQFRQQTPSNIITMLMPRRMTAHVPGKRRSHKHACKKASGAAVQLCDLLCLT